MASSSFKIVMLEVMALLLGIGIVSPLAAVAASNPAAANHSEHFDFYVSPNGSDAHSLQQAQHPASAWKTLVHAAAALNVGPAGTSVHVAPGTYVGQIKTYKSGAPDARIRFVSDVPKGAKLIGSESANWLVFGAYTDIIGFDMTGPDLNESVAIYAPGGRVLGNLIHDISTRAGCVSSGAIVFAKQAPEGAAIGNIIRHVGQVVGSQCNQDHGIYMEAPRTTVQNNVISGVVAFGIHIYGDNCYDKVTNNTIFNNGWSGIVVSGSTNPVCKKTDYETISNNIVVNNDHYGIEEDARSVGAHNAYFNNLLFGNRLGDYRVATAQPSASKPTGRNDTVFVNYKDDGTGDYHLRSGSPAIAAGSKACAPTVAACTPTIDLEGGVRRSDTNPSLGAYEYAAVRTQPRWAEELDGILRARSTADSANR
jgi:parallel beta-helix repeat protein